MLLVEQELLTLREHTSSPPVFSGVCDAYIQSQKIGKPNNLSLFGATKQYMGQVRVPPPTPTPKKEKEIHIKLD